MHGAQILGLLFKGHHKTHTKIHGNSHISTNSKRNKKATGKYYVGLEGRDTSQLEGHVQGESRGPENHVHASPNSPRPLGAHYLGTWGAREGYYKPQCL